MNRFNYNFILKPFFLIWDISGFFLAYIIAWCFQSQIFSFHYIATLFESNYNESLTIVVISTILWISISFILNMQHVPHRKSNKQMFKYFYYPQIIFCLIILLFIIVSNYDSLSRLFIVYYFIFQFILLLVARVIRTTLVKSLRFRGHNTINLIVIADTQICNKINNWITKRPWSGIHMNNIKSDELNNTFERYSNIIKNLKVGDYLLLDKNFISDESIYAKIIMLAEDIGIEVFEIIVNTEIKYNLGKKQITQFGPYYTFKNRNQPLKNSINQINKSIFDFIFSLLFLIFIFSWSHIFISIIIKLSSKGPIFFRQKRVGKDGIIFECIKYRTMNQKIHNFDQITQKNDPRIYAFGNFLRKTNLDEFPQFINVLLGQMSIVGPRPHMIKEDDMLAKELSKYRIRHWVRPGITGLAAVNGFRGGTEDMELMQKRINFDIEYIENWSLLSDIKICLGTFGAMLFRRNLGH